MTISPTQNDVETALRAFLLTVLPAGWDAIVAVANRVPEPAIKTFAVMTAIRFERLRTNIDAAADAKFTASIAGTSMTVSAVAIGLVAIGSTVFGPGVAAGTKVVSGPGGGGPGVYTVTPSQTVSPAETMSSGQKTLEQGTQVTVQIDFHSADNTSGDAAQIVSTTLRDDYGMQVFADQGLGVVPLYADDPRYVPFVNDQQQYEWRWTVEARFQINQVVAVPQQYFDGANVTVISVEAQFPP